MNNEFIDTLTDCILPQKNSSHSLPSSVLQYDGMNN